MPNSSTLHTPAFPTLLGDGYGLYRRNPRNFMLGFLAQSISVAALAAIAAYFGQNPRLGPRLGTVIENIGPISYPLSSDKSGGHGGGGDHEKFAASRGALPKMTLDDPLTPPEAVPRNLDPKLPEPPSVMALSAVRLPQLGQLGDPLTGVQGPPSNGPGRNGGIGDGCCGGVGSKNGPGFGPYDQGNVFWPGKGGVTAPRPIFDPDPEYSDAARKAKYQGSVLLWLIIGPNGRPRNIRVQRSLGMGLDEKALDAVSRWRFQPATLNGQPVAVQINVEVSFRLY
jgi:periplasmic protein TonB